MYLLYKKLRNNYGDRKACFTFTFISTFLLTLRFIKAWRCFLLKTRREQFSKDSRRPAKY